MDESTEKARLIEEVRETVDNERQALALRAGWSQFTLDGLRNMVDDAYARPRRSLQGQASTD